MDGADDGMERIQLPVVLPSVHSSEPQKTMHRRHFVQWTLIVIKINAMAKLKLELRVFIILTHTKEDEIKCANIH